MHLVAEQRAPALVLCVTEMFAELFRRRLIAEGAKPESCNRYGIMDKKSRSCLYVSIFMCMHVCFSRISRD